MTTAAQTTTPLPLSLRILSLRPTQPTITTTIAHENATTTTTTTSVIPACAVCQERPSQYTCPRCHILYCSVSCYQQHGIGRSDKDDVVNTNSDDDGRRRRSGGCTEEFYENRVVQITQLEVKERLSPQMRRDCDMFLRSNSDILYRNDNNNDNDNDEIRLDRSHTGSTNTNDFCVTPPHDRLNRDELLQLWSVLEQWEDYQQSNNQHGIKDDDETMLFDQMLQQQCSTHVQHVIRQTMRNLSIHPSCPSGGTTDRVQAAAAAAATTEWILEPWSPWWRPHVHRPLVLRPPHTDDDECETNDDDDNDDDNDEVVEQETFPFTTEETRIVEEHIHTLDERMMKLPRFSTLYRMKQFASDVDANLQQLPLLQFNLVDILYSTIFTLRLYHGVNNVLQQDMAIDAAMTLVSGSAVLMKDMRYTTLESVLIECNSIDRRNVDAATELSRNSVDNGSVLPRALLIQDVALTYRNDRLVMRALFEATDILKAAVSELKSSIQSSDTMAAIGHTEQRNHLQRIYKKLQFYLSWIVATKDLCKGAWPYARLSTDIQLWIEAWHIPTIDI
jgi:HIT zinc finger